MIVVNEDKAVNEKSVKKSKSLLKGQIINHLLVLEDILDLSIINHSFRYRCVCKCLDCGRVFTVSSWRLRRKSVSCVCSKYHRRGLYKFRYLRGKMLKFLVSERNKAEAEMLFEEDLKRVEGFDTVINFINSKSLKNYFLNGY